MHGLLKPEMEQLSQNIQQLVNFLGVWVWGDSVFVCSWLFWGLVLLVYLFIY